MAGGRPSIDQLSVPEADNIPGRQGWWFAYTRLHNHLWVQPFKNKEYVSGFFKRIAFILVMSFTFPISIPFGIHALRRHYQTNPKVTAQKLNTVAQHIAGLAEKAAKKGSSLTQAQVAVFLAPPFVTQQNLSALMAKSVRVLGVDYSLAVLLCMHKADNPAKLAVIAARSGALLLNEAAKSDKGIVVEADAQRELYDAFEANFEALNTSIQSTKKTAAGLKRLKEITLRLAAMPDPVLVSTEPRTAPTANRQLLSNALLKLIALLLNGHLNVCMESLFEKKYLTELSDKPEWLEVANAVTSAMSAQQPEAVSIELKTEAQEPVAAATNESKPEAVVVVAPAAVSDVQQEAVPFERESEGSGISVSELSKGAVPEGTESSAASINDNENAYKENAVGTVAVVESAPIAVNEVGVAAAGPDSPGIELSGDAAQTAFQQAAEFEQAFLTGSSDNREGLAVVHPVMSAQQPEAVSAELEIEEQEPVAAATNESVQQEEDLGISGSEFSEDTLSESDDTGSSAASDEEADKRKPVAKVVEAALILEKALDRSGIDLSGGDAAQTVQAAKLDLSRDDLNVSVDLADGFADSTSVPAVLHVDFEEDADQEKAPVTEVVSAAANRFQEQDPLDRSGIGFHDTPPLSTTPSLPASIVTAPVEKAVVAFDQQPLIVAKAAFDAAVRGFAKVHPDSSTWYGAVIHDLQKNQHYLKMQRIQEDLANIIQNNGEAGLPEFCQLLENFIAGAKKVHDSKIVVIGHLHYLPALENLKKALDPIVEQLKAMDQSALSSPIKLQHFSGGLTAGTPVVAAPPVPEKDDLTLAAAGSKPPVLRAV